MRENKIEQALCRSVRAAGGDCLKLHLANLIGFPDRTIVGPGRTIGFVELKTRRGKLSSSQEFWIRTLSNYGFAVAVVRSEDEAREFVRTLFGVIDDGD